MASAVAWTAKQLRSMRLGQIRNEPSHILSARSQHTASEADQASWVKLGRSVSEALDILNRRDGKWE